MEGKRHLFVYCSGSVGVLVGSLVVKLSFKKMGYEFKLTDPRYLKHLATHLKIVRLEEFSKRKA